MVEREHEEVPMRTQTRLLTLNTALTYYKASEPSDEEVRLKHRIDEIYTGFPVYGVGKSRKNSGLRAGISTASTYNVACARWTSPVFTQVLT